MPLRVHAHVSHYDDQQYHFRKPQFSTAQRVCDPANHAAALCATFRNTTTKPTVIKDRSLVGGMSLSVKVFGCRPHDGGAARTRPASANLHTSGPMQRRTAALPVQPGGEIPRRTSLKTPYCT